MASKVWFFIASAIAVAGSIGVSRADVVYSYKGQAFQSAFAPYTTSNFETITLVYISALAANLSNAQEIPLSYAFNDGVQDITQATTTEFFISTNATGNITGWILAAQTSEFDFIQSVNLGITQDLSYTNADFAYNNDDQGTWSTTVSPVPEPSTLPLSAAVLMVLGWLRRKAFGLAPA
jgi:hypothetical protein